MAGALKPAETFDPYLTAYPLTSAYGYVLARTWQDLQASRAGCVQTLSLIIGMSDWAHAPSIQTYIARLSSPILGDAANEMYRTSSDWQRVSAEPSDYTELVEALFLEDRQPVVIFGAPQAEYTATRLLTALWPSIRMRFALSTFALSPRKLARRDFDLVFAPKHARPKFADWNGRRIDAQSAQASPRHEWTASLVSAIFECEVPHLVTGRAADLIRDDETGNVAALRVALLWDELSKKARTIPFAVLGLLDIVNARDPGNHRLLDDLQTHIIKALGALSQLPAADAWTFVEALTRKLKYYTIDSVVESSAVTAVSELTASDASKALDVLMGADNVSSSEILITGIALGLSLVYTAEVAQALKGLPPDVLLRVLLASESLARVALRDDAQLLEILDGCFSSASEAEMRRVRAIVLPCLTDDVHAQLGASLIGRLDEEELIAEARHLYIVNKLSSRLMVSAIANRARELPSKTKLRDVADSLGTEEGPRDLVAAVVRPVPDDIIWLCNRAENIGDPYRSLIAGIIKVASFAEICLLWEYTMLGERLVSLLPSSADGAEALERVELAVKLPIDVLISNGSRIMLSVVAEVASRLAAVLLERSVEERIGGDEIAMVASLLGKAVANVDTSGLVRNALGARVDGCLASRNVIAFSQTSEVGRRAICSSIEDVAIAIRARGKVDLSDDACLAVAKLFLAADSINPRSALRASLLLMPFLLQARQSPVSSIIAVAFPVVYRELRKGSDFADLLRLFLFVDWDRCKVARRELVDAFQHSTWPSTDLALAAARADDAVRILHLLSATEQGKQFIRKIARDIDSIPAPWRSRVSQALSEV
jgi:hypothetical protein